MDLVDAETAARLLGVSKDQVHWLARNGQLQRFRVGGLSFFDRAEIVHEVRRRVEDAESWISYAAAAKIVGCSTATIGAAVRRGDIINRASSSTGGRGGRAALAAATVRIFAERLNAQRLAAASEAAARAGRRPAAAPPDNDSVWLSVRTTAVVLGLSPSRVKQLAEADRMPHTRTATRIWFRRQDVENAAATRAFHARQRAARPRD